MSIVFLYTTNTSIKGHILVITKRHVQSFFDLTKEELKDVYELLYRSKNELKKHKHDIKEFNVEINDGKYIGQTIICFISI
jgi:diadenosine tetraphosphate (Ap4A) HIT family hydrolase